MCRLVSAHPREVELQRMDAERGVATADDGASDDGFDIPTIADGEFLLEPIDMSALTPWERKVRKFKDCFWTLEASLAWCFGLEDSKFAYELEVKEEEEEEGARAEARAEEMSEAEAAVAAASVEGGAARG